MKRLGKLLLLPLAMLLTVSCQTFIDQVGGGGSKITAVLAMMEDEGYVDIDANNTPSQYQYYEGKIKDDYDLELDVTGFYQGYVPEYTRWAMIVVFASSADATSFHTALVGDVTASGYKSVWDTIVLHTASLETYTAFDALKHTATSSSQAASTTSTTTTSTATTSTATSVPTSSATSQDNGDYLTEAEMLTILYDAGYTNLDYSNDQETWTYRENYYLTTYSLVVDVYGFYQGYIMDGETQTDWLKMEVFGTAEQAADVEEAVADTEHLYEYTHLEGRILVVYANPLTWLLFN